MTVKGVKKAAGALALALLVLCLCTACGKQEVSSTPVVVSTSQSVPEEVQPVEEPIPYISPRDFQSLMSRNLDIIAWITVDGTNIDYPVNRTTDNAFYLTHDAYGEYYAGGSLFIDMSNYVDFSSPVTLMYGHVMPNDTLFSQLHLFKDPEFFAANRTITVDTPRNCFVYEIFAAFPHDKTNLLYQKDYSTTEDFEGLLSYIAQKAEEEPENSIVELADVGPEDQLLLLSTCDNEGANRYLVAGRLVEKAAE